MKEYFKYCKMVFPDDQYSCILTREKMFRFMYYQAFRKKKSHGGRRVDNVNKPAFDVEAYERVILTCVDPTTEVIWVTVLLAISRVKICDLPNILPK